MHISLYTVWKKLERMEEVYVAIICDSYNPSVCSYSSEASNKAEDEAEWEREVTDEVKEIKGSLQEEHEKAMEVYKKEADRYKQQKADKVRIKTLNSWRYDLKQFFFFK